MNNAADEIVILSDALEALRLRTEELEQKLDTTAQPLAAASVALGGALDGIKALQFHVRDSNLGTLSSRIDELRGSVAEKIAAFSTQLVEADKRLESEQRQNVDGLRVELGAIGSAVAALSEKFGSELARIETDAKAEFSRIEQIKLQVGPEGRSLNPRGTFVDGETYNRLDVVSWLGSSYIAAVDGVTEKPSRNSNQWQVLASRGGGAGGVGDFASLAGVAQINQGGTGQTTRAAALNALLPSQTGATQYVLLTDGSGNVSWGAQPVAGLPSQTSNGGKLLTTDGTNASWSNAVTVSGGNATVTGTLTVNGTSTFNNTLTVSSNVGFIGKSGSGTGGNWRYISDDGTSRWLSGILGTPSETAFDIYDIVNGRSLLTLTAAGVVKVPQTTASTSTSSGALVVGNGTSGGLGVGGSICLGANIVSAASDGKFQITGTGNTTGNKEISLQRSDAADSFAIGLTGSAYAGVLTGLGNNEAFIYNSSASAFRIFLGIASTNRFDFTSSQFKINPTTASTSTSTGALVVSGGVGIAKALFAGESAYFAGAVGATDAVIKNGYGRSANGYAYLDLVGDTTYTDYGMRIIRNNSGANANSQIAHRGTGALQLIASDAGTIEAYTNGANLALAINTSQQVQVKATTASSSTTTGALVVSGGVGVAGAIYAGGSIRVVGSSHTTRFRHDDAIIDFSNTAENAYVTGTISGNTLQLKGNNGTGLTIGTTGNATFAGTLTVSAGSLVVDHVGSSSPTLSLSANGSVQSRFFSNGSNTFLESYTNTPLILRTNQTTALTITTGQQVQVNATTASTSTSTGALVVSGGVGVAKSVIVGEEIAVDRTTSDQTLLRLYATGTTGNFINFAETSIGGQSTGVAFLRWTRGGNEDRAFSVHVSNSSGTSIKATTVDASGNLIQALNGTAPSLATNSTMTFELTSNTSLKIFVRGSDGTTRSTTLTLA